MKKKPIMQDFVHFTWCKDLNEMDIWVRNSIRMIMSIDANINNKKKQFEMFIVQLQTNNNITRIVFPFLMLLRIAKLAAPVVENCLWFKKRKKIRKRNLNCRICSQFKFYVCRLCSASYSRTLVHSNIHIT